ncbi:MAG: D-alanyl-D-alanine carboxypeptidase family protein [Porcipelethomonas sp.]
MKKLLSVIISAAVIFSAVQTVCSEESEHDYTRCSLLMEASTGTVLTEDNGYVRVPQGTMTKLMTVLLAAEEIDEGRLDLDTAVTAGSSAEERQGAVVWIRSGESITVEELLKSAIIGNANDACVVIAEQIGRDEQGFTDMMNARAFELGMRDTVFRNCDGFDETGQYSTAYDIALLCRELLKHDFLYKYFNTWMDTVRNGQTEIVNENRLVRSYKGLIGMKASHSEQSGYSLAAAASSDGKTYISVVLGCSDKDERFSLGKELLGIGFSSYRVTTPSFSDEFLRPVEVKGGTDRAVEIEAETLEGLVVPKSSKEPDTVIVIPLYLNAPVKKGQTIGKLGFYNGDSLIYETNLVAASSVDSMSMKIAVKRFLSILFK